MCRTISDHNISNKSGKQDLNSQHQIKQAVFWSASDILLRRGIGFFIAIVLARLITPEEFGVFAMLILFTAVASLFAESGFASALIQRQDHTYTDECTVFWFNLVAGALAALALVVIAPWIADFYQQPVLTPLTRLMALNLWLSAFLTVPMALLTKKLDFQIQMKASVIAVTVSGAIAIYLALNGWGVWAIAIQIVSATIINVLVLWRINPWRPTWKYSWKSFRKLFNFGGFLLFSSLIDRISTQLYTLIIGKSYGALDLGYFYRASSTKDLPQGVLADIFSRVAFPVFSSQADDSNKLRKSLRTALITTMAVNLPVMAGLMMTADELVPILFGPQWGGAIPILKVLCGLGAFWPMHLANLNVLMALGHSKLIFKLEIIKKTLFIITIILVSQISVIAIAWGMFALGLLGIFVNTWYTRKFLEFGALEQVRVVLPYLSVTLIMILAVGTTQYLLASDSTMVVLFAKITVGVLIYFLFCYVFKLKILEYGRLLLK